MRRIVAYTFLVIALLVSVVYIAKDPTQSITFVKPAAMSAYDITMKQDVLCLMLAYPEHIKDIERNINGNVYLTLKSGQRLIYDDKRTKNIEQKIADPDLQDMLEQPYPLTEISKLMDMDFDPGRVRIYGLLKAVYGSSQKQVEAQLGSAKALGRSFQFSRSNGASAALESAMKEVIPLAKSSRRVSAAAFPSSGTYNYRLISGTQRLSPHSFGIAIDLARDSRDYWQWATREQGQKRLEAYPQELVKVFEKHSFVWGGKWGHFDILHFEYRPEIIMKARYFGEYKAGDTWYKGAPEEDSVKELVKKIDNSLN